MVKAKTVVGAIFGFGGIAALGYVLMSKLGMAAPDGQGPAGKFGIINAGNYTTEDDLGAHQFQFEVDGNNLGDEDVKITVEGVYSKTNTIPELVYKVAGVQKSVFSNTYHTPPADQINQVTVIPHIVEAVNIYITRVRTGEKFWFQCIVGCKKITGG